MHKNENRFLGFADVYDAARPACPAQTVQLILRYLGRSPGRVVDVGCGTGLSTMIWADIAGEVIGVEPSDDMRGNAAARAAGRENVRFVKAFSDRTGLDDRCADVVTCSQSFHWMEPVSTLREVSRILRPGGVFAAYDCDWPPACCAAADAAYDRLLEYVREIERTDSRYGGAFVLYPKERHLEHIRSSGYFGFTRELVFANAEPCGAARYNAIAESQGGVQAILKREPERLAAQLRAFRAAVDAYFAGQTKEIVFCYRMRLGVK